MHYRGARVEAGKLVTRLLKDNSEKYWLCVCTCMLRHGILEENSSFIAVSIEMGMKKTDLLVHSLMLIN